MKVENNERDLLDPAIKGTMSVLTSIQNHAPNVKRVIITSSFASIIDMNKNPRPGYTYTENDWNPVTYEEAASSSASGEIAYLASKTLAERAAWDLVAKNKPNFQLATICPPMVYGPAFHTISSLEHLNTSSADIYRLMNGSEKAVPKTQYYAFCDVRDVGEAHARAYETHESAGQRYFCTAGGYTYQQVCDIIREDFPEKKALVPEGEAGDPVDRYKVDNSKIKKELGMTFKDLKTCIDDQVREFIEIEKRAKA
jgi:nucleoside-diphosphate-sugar epimerase